MSTGVSSKGFFWEIKDANNAVVGHLLGTMHACPSTLLNDRMSACFSEATVVAVESTDELEPLFTNQLKKSLSEQTPEQRAKFNDHLSWVRVPFYDPLMRAEEDLLVRKIAAAYRTYGLGHGTKDMMDKELIEKAVRAYQHVEGLEYYTICSPDQYDILVDYLTETENFADKLAVMAFECRTRMTEERITQHRNIWKEGRDGDVEKILSVCTVEQVEKSQVRNCDMARKLASIIEKLQAEKLGTVFCAVGVAHMFGEKSIQSYLQNEYNFTAHRL